MNTRLSSVPSALTSRRGAWASLGLALLFILALFGSLSSVEAPTSGNDGASLTSESAQVDALLDEFPGSKEQSVLIVATPADGGTITQDDAALEGLAQALSAYDLSGPMVAEDNEAALFIAPITVGENNSETSAIIEELRTTIADAHLALNV